jgi:hypothetical protein
MKLTPIHRVNKQLKTNTKAKQNIENDFVDVNSPNILVKAKMGYRMIGLYIDDRNVSPWPS